MSAGERLRYEPSAIVFYAVSEERIQKKYFLEWWLDYDRADARLFEIPRVHLLGSLVVWTLRWMVALEPQRRFHHKLVVWEKVGRAIDLYWQWREGKTKKERYSTP